MKIYEKIKQKQSDIFAYAAPTIAFLGDSVTEGCFEIYKTGERSLDTIRDYENNYQNKLRNLIFKDFGGCPVNIINGGISGGNAVNGYSRLDRDILCHKPDLVVVCFGLNDCCGKDEGYNDFVLNIERILKEILAFGAEAIFMTPNMTCKYVNEELKQDKFFFEITEDMIQTADDGFLKKYVDGAKKVCAKLNVPICDCFAEWKKLDNDGTDITALLANGINHPTREMHSLFAEKLYEIIKAE